MKTLVIVDAEVCEEFLLVGSGRGCSSLDVVLNISVTLDPPVQVLGS